MITPFADFGFSLCEKLRELLFYQCFSSATIVSILFLNNIATQLSMYVICFILLRITPVSYHILTFPPGQVTLVTYIWNLAKYHVSEQDLLYPSHFVPSDFLVILYPSIGHFILLHWPFRTLLCFYKLHISSLLTSHTPSLYKFISLL